MNIRLKRALILHGAACALALFAISTVASAATITSGQLVSLRVGDGTTTPSSTGLPVTLDVYDVTYTGGAPSSVTWSQSIPLPTATSGPVPASGNRYLVQGGTAGGEGGLTLSTNGAYMALAGYNNIVGGTTNASGNNSGDRVVGLLNLGTGAVDTTTDFNLGANSTSAIRNAFTTDGTNIWAATSGSGVRYTTSGGSTSTPLTASGNERRIYVYNGQLYTSRQSAPVDGPATVGSGIPTSGTQTVTALPGLPIVNNQESAYDYFFADANTLYIADDGVGGAAGNGPGLQKWTFNAGTWTRVYNKLAGGTAGIKSLGGYVDGNGYVYLFGSSVGTGANKLYGWGDTIGNTNVANVAENQLVDVAVPATFNASGTAWNLRGVAIVPPPVPEPTTLVLLLVGTAGFVARHRARRA